MAQSSADALSRSIEMDQPQRCCVQPFVWAANPRGVVFVLPEDIDSGMLIDPDALCVHRRKAKDVGAAASSEPASERHVMDLTDVIS